MGGTLAYWAGVMLACVALAAPCAFLETCFANWLDGGRFHV